MQMKSVVVFAFAEFEIEINHSENEYANGEVMICNWV